MIKKYLVDIELRYNGPPKNGNNHCSHTSKTITIAICNTFDEACVKGNELMEHLETRFKRHVFPSGLHAAKERFSKNGSCFGSPNTLITNGAYLKTPFQFFAQIKTLSFNSIDNKIDNAISDVKKYKNYEKRNFDN
jgi:hypothetical protein